MCVSPRLPKLTDRGKYMKYGDEKQIKYGIDLVGGILALGVVFWLAGGADWLSEKTRQMKLENDKQEQELKASSLSKNS